MVSVMSPPWYPAALIVRKNCNIVVLFWFDVVIRRVNTYYECLRFQSMGPNTEAEGRGPSDPVT